MQKVDQSKSQLKEAEVSCLWTIPLSVLPAGACLPSYLRLVLPGQDILAKMRFQVSELSAATAKLRSEQAELTSRSLEAEAERLQTLVAVVQRRAEVQN